MISDQPLNPYVYPFHTKSNCTALIDVGKSINVWKLPYFVQTRPSLDDHSLIWVATEYSECIPIEILKAFYIKLELSLGT